MSIVLINMHFYLDNHHNVPAEKVDTPTKLSTIGISIHASSKHQLAPGEALSAMGIAKIEIHQTPR